MEVAELGHLGPDLFKAPGGFPVRLPPLVLKRRDCKVEKMRGFLLFGLNVLHLIGLRPELLNCVQGPVILFLTGLSRPNGDVRYGIPEAPRELMVRKFPGRGSGEVVQYIPVLEHLAGELAHILELDSDCEGPPYRTVAQPHPLREPRVPHLVSYQRCGEFVGDIEVGIDAGLDRALPYECGGEGVDGSDLHALESPEGVGEMLGLG